MYMLDMTNEERKQVLLEFYTKAKAVTKAIAVEIKKFIKHKMNSIPAPYLILGFVLSTISFALCATVNLLNQNWTLDNTYTLVFSPWSFTGIEAASIVVDANRNIPDATSTFFSYCSLTFEKTELFTSTYCSPFTALSSALLIISTAAATVSYICSTFIVFDRKFWTWDGAGIECTLSFVICCTFLQLVSAGSAALAWMYVHFEMDTKCTPNATVKTCVSLGDNLIVFLPASFVLSLVVLWYWRKTNMFRRDKASGKMNDSFILAVKKDDVDGVLESVLTGVNINALGSDGRNALHWAASLNRSAIVHILLTKGADVCATDTDGWTPMHWAARFGNADVIRILSNHHQDNSIINVKDMWGTTPLMLSIIGNNAKATRLLLDAGAALDSRNVFGQTSLMMCAEEGPSQRDTAVMLKNSGATLPLTDIQGNSAVHYAASSGDIYTLETILEACSSDNNPLYKEPNAFNETPYDEAVTSNSVGATNVLLKWEYGPEVDLGSEKEEDYYSEEESEDSSSSSDSSD